MVKTSLTPWVNNQEWNHVRDLMVSRQTQAALDHLKVWSTRVDQLPVGVFLTSILLEGSKNLKDRLAMSMTICRFIEHISFVGYKNFKSCNMYESVEPLNLPVWIVNLRHEAVHGKLPSIHNLRSAFENCYAWIVLNYWQIERVESSPSYDRLSSLLDLYLYLRIYREWGTNNLSDLESEQGLFYHMKELWNSNIHNIFGRQFIEFSVDQAIDEVNHVLCQMKLDPMTLIHVLVDEDLLVPQKEFLQSLVEDHETEDDVQIPGTLLSVWKVMICSIDAKVGAKCLINCLVNKINEEDIDETRAEYFAAWIVELSEGMLGRSNKLKLRQDHMCSVKDLEHWLATPNRLIETLLPCFVSLAGINKQKFRLLQQLLATTDPENDVSPNNKKVAASNDQIYTLKDLLMIDLKKSDQNLEDKSIKVNGDEPITGESKWKLEPDWKQEKHWFKLFDGQSWESLWLPNECEWQEAAESDGSDLEDENQYDIEVGVTQWPQWTLINAPKVWVPPTFQVASGSGNSKVPQFYRNESTQIGPKRNYSRFGMGNEKRNNRMMPCPKRTRFALKDCVS